ncbi:cytochrome-c oxidase [Neisseria leonii]|uniref:Cytochrome-c oxidase n=1 Tax=Neisseria leonii TaxID=2995413 RepID=A0A9X4E335_9NEIS|nr:cytochrome-c oxidase [Neisseria sp. 51.81]MDD9328717.1 cytochrome-c oxidase [Neisseria sp. 51.81]
MNSIDLGKIQPQPYESFEEAEARREAELDEVYAPLTDAQREAVRGQSGINPVSQTVSDLVEDVAHPNSHTGDTDKQP